METQSMSFDGQRGSYYMKGVGTKNNFKIPIPEWVKKAKDTKLVKYFVERKKKKEEEKEKDRPADPVDQNSQTGQVDWKLGELKIGKQPLPEKRNERFKEFLAMLKKSETDITFTRLILSELNIPNATDRTIPFLKELSWEDSLDYAETVKTGLAKCFINDFHDMDQDDPQSIERLTNWNKQEKTLFSVSSNDMEIKIQRLIEKSLAFVKSSVGQITTEKQIVIFAERHAGGVYYPKCDVKNESRKNFRDQAWLKITSLKSEEIADKDIQECLVLTSTNEKTLNDRVRLMLKAEEIILRPFLTNKKRCELARKFEPILAEHIKFFHSIDPDEFINKIEGDALKIRRDFYKEPLEIFKPVEEEVSDTDTKENNREPATIKEKSLVEQPEGIDTESSKPAKSNQQPEVVDAEEDDDDELKALGLSINSNPKDLLVRDGDSKKIKRFKIRLQLEQEERASFLEKDYQEGVVMKNTKNQKVA